MRLDVNCKDINFKIARPISRRFYYGWVVMGVVFCANLSVFSFNPTFGLFITPLETELGWDREMIARSLTLGTIMGAVLAPLLGFLIDRFGTRRLTVLFGIGAALGYLLLSRTERIWQFNLMMGIVFALSVTGVGQMMGPININHWFVRRRGRAMGAVMMGASAGSVIFIPVSAWLIAEVGWRGAYQVLGAMAFLLVSGPAFLLLVNQPEQLGLGDHPEIAGVSRGSGEPAANGVIRENRDRVWGLREAAGTRMFWLILAGIMMGGFTVQGYFIHAIPHMESLGFSRVLASSVWGSFFLTGVFAKFMWGFIIERIGVKRGLVFLFLAEAGGLYLLMTARSPAALFTYAVINGLGHGPFLQLLAMVWAEYFGRQSITRIYGSVQPAIVVASSLGPWLGGYMYDRNGSYQGFFQLCIAMSLGAVVLFLLAPSPQRFLRRASRKGS